MITNVSSARYLYAPRLFHAQRSGRTQVPVRPGDSVYAHFEHVEGIPSRSHTIPLIKLRILDKLIARLAGVQQEIGAESVGIPEPRKSLLCFSHPWSRAGGAGQRACLRLCTPLFPGQQRIDRSGSPPALSHSQDHRGSS
jgi:hypothetical protein